MNRMLWSALIVLSSATAAWADDSPAAAAADAPQAKAPANDSTGAPAPSGEVWRYKRHQGLWWYWLPSNKWVYWTDNRWVPYDAESYAKFNAARQPATTTYGQQSYSTNSPYPPAGTWGPWGPVRYNGYGQIQWPYSQRSSGVRQLGAVPAMGGVRSLPGWGGER
jgi:hypothetical protein